MKSKFAATILLVLEPQLYLDLKALHNQVMKRPFPSGAMIMNMVSKAFPMCSQDQCYRLTAKIKETINRQEFICNLATQKSHAN